MFHLWFREEQRGARLGTLDGLGITTYVRCGSVELTLQAAPQGKPSDGQRSLDAHKVDSNLENVMTPQNVGNKVTWRSLSTGQWRGARGGHETEHLSAHDRVRVDRRDPSTPLFRSHVLVSAPHVLELDMHHEQYRVSHTKLPQGQSPTRRRNIMETTPGDGVRGFQSSIFFI